MAERSKFFDDLAGVAGGTLSALSGLRDEAEALVRSQVDEAIRRLALVRREEFDAVAAMAAGARADEAALKEQILAMDVRLAALEARLAAVETRSPVVVGGGPGMIA